MSYQSDIIEQIDDILCLILKADRYQVIANNLKDLLLKTWEREKKAAIELAIMRLEEKDGNLDDNDIKYDIIPTLESKLGQPLADACRQAVADSQLTAYKQSFRNVDGKSTNIEFSFNKASKDALKWLEKNETYWIGNFFGSQIKEKLGANLGELAKPIMEQGMSRAEAGKFLRTICENQFDLPEGFKGHITQYWEGLSDHIVTKAREFGRVDAYDRAGIEYARVVAVMDARTTVICREMNGRVFPVSHLRDKRDKIIAAKTPEEAKEVSPWFSDAKATEQVTGKTTQQLMEGKETSGLALPPYHFKCRTITVGASKEEWEEQNQAEGSNAYKDFTSEALAKKWAENNIAESVNYPKFSDDEAEQVKIINEINKTIYDINIKYGLGKLKAIIEDKRGDNAFYRSRNDVIGIGKSVVETLDNYKNKQKKYYRAKTDKEAHSYYYSNSMEDVLVHEMGHRLHFKNYDIFDEMFRKSYNWQQEYGVTGRSRDDIFECVAENFSLLFHKEKYNVADIKLNSDITAIIKSLEK